MKYRKLNYKSFSIVAVGATMFWEWAGMSVWRRIIDLGALKT